MKISNNWINNNKKKCIKGTLYKPVKTGKSNVTPQCFIYSNYCLPKNMSMLSEFSENLYTIWNTCYKIISGHQLYFTFVTVMFSSCTTIFPLRHEQCKLSALHDISCFRTCIVTIAWNFSKTVALFTQKQKAKSAPNALKTVIIQT